MTSPKTVYGWKEHIYCAPLADWLATSPQARSSLFAQLGRPDYETSTLLAKEQNEIRHTKFWWKNVYCPDTTCTCAGLSGTEVDIFMVFENQNGRRLAIHLDCKTPEDTFSNPGQGANYRARAECWLDESRRPAKVLPHDEFATVLLTDRPDRHSKEQVASFDHVLTFDWVAGFLTPYPDTGLRYHGAAPTWTERTSG